MAMSTSNAFFWPFGGMLDAMGMGDNSDNEIPQSSTPTVGETLTAATEQAKAATKERQKAARRSATVYSSSASRRPSLLSTSTEAGAIRKTLLGQ